MYSSRILEDTWGFGKCTVQEADWASANYVARYVTKKLVDPMDGSDDRRAEFVSMSRKPGIGNVWATRYAEEWFSRDELVSNGVPMRPPRYYEGIIEKQNPRLLQEVKRERVARAAEVECERVVNTEVTHHSVEVVRAARLASLSRDGVE